MASLRTMAQMQLVLFLLMAAGFLMCKIKVVNYRDQGLFSKLLLYLFHPCNIVMSFGIEDVGQSSGDLALVVVISIAVCVGSYVVSKKLFRKTPWEKQSVLRYGLMMTLASFMGSAIAEEMYGRQGLMYASIFVAPLRVMMWTAGLGAFTQTNAREGIRKALTHPCVIAVGIGLVRMTLAIPFPGFISAALTHFARCTTPISMFIVGVILASAPMHRPDGNLMGYCMLRLLAFPALVFAVLWFLPVPRLVVCISVLLTGMPAASTTAIMASQYKADAFYASQMILVSTMLSMVTLPILSMLLELVR